jgi:hypothetical protein
MRGSVNGIVAGRRLAFVLVWAIAFSGVALLVILPVANIILGAAYYLQGANNSDSSDNVRSMICLVPTIAAFAGFVLGLLGRLPGTKSHGKAGSGSGTGHP